MKFILLLLLGSFLAAVEPFTLVIKTDLPGTSANNAFTLPLSTSPAYNFTVAWGDGATDVVTSNTSPTHTYAAVGTYSVQITENVAGGFSQIYFNFGGDCQKLQQIAKWGDVTWSSMGGAFFGCSNLVITATDGATARTGAVTMFSQAWAGCSSLTSFPVLNTSSGTNFGEAWLGCEKLTSFPLLNTAAGTIFLSTWNNCSGLTTFPALNTTAGTNFSSAWAGCSSLTTFPALNTAVGTDFSGAWSGCSGLTSFPLLNTAAGTSFYGAWFGCSGLTAFPSLNTSAGSNFYRTWLGCTGLHDFPTLDLRNMNSGFECFKYVTLSPHSYGDLLKALANNNVRTAVVFSGGNSKYPASATSARNSTLIAARGWTITDGGAGFPPEISSANSANAVISQPFSYQIVASNSPTAYGASGLPTGLSVNTSTGAITGTNSGSVATYSATISATNAEGTDTIPLTISVSQIGAPAITSATTAGSIPGSPLTYQITATNTPTSYNATGLPSGLTVNTTTGAISGTPAAAGTSAITLFATNANGTGVATLTLTVATPGGSGGGGSSSGGGCGMGAGAATALLLTFSLLHLHGLGLRRRRKQAVTQPA